MNSVDYDDSNLQRLFEELEPKRRLQALKGAYRKEAGKVRKMAVNNLRSTGVHTSKGLEKGVRALVFKKKVGFRVTVGERYANKNGKGEAGFHTNRQGLKKPVLRWMDTGTKDRRTKKGARRGRMKRYGFIAKTTDDVRDTVTGDLRGEIVNSILRVAKKYGCK